MALLCFSILMYFHVFSNANKQFNIILVAEKAGDFSTEWEGMMILQDNNIIAGHS